MPRILAAAHALPPLIVPQAEVREVAARLFCADPHLAPLLEVFTHSTVAFRPLLRPPLWYLENHAPAARQRIFQEEGLLLVKQAAEAALRSAGLSATEIDHLILVTSTGVAAPTLDARLINEAGFRAEITRAPLWGLGCAGGAAGLARAREYLLAFPERRVLLVAVECCSLTLLPADVSRKNLIATALFGDGAAAVVLAGSGCAGRGPRLAAATAYLFPDSYDLMGWNFRDTGMELVLSPQLPDTIQRHFGALLGRLMASRPAETRGIRHYLLHPGGPRVLDACAAALALPPAALALSRSVLAAQGNLSSVSVLVVLQRWLESCPDAGLALLAAFGPGFAAELLLLEVG